MTKEKAGAYLRLSRDEDKENYDSLLTQKNLLIRYAEEHDIEIVDFYVDDNVSGYIFDERPEFNRMLEDLYNNKFDIVLAKDLSRIGRNNARTLLFLEELSIRDKKLILASRNYDSSKDDDDIMGIETWYNERYVKDISKKIRANLEQKQNSGDLLVRATFGYIKDGNKLLIDNETAPIVREIFDLYKQGHGYRKISNIMNEKGYPTPSIADGTKRPSSHIWNSTHIHRILKNDIYTGVHNLRKTIRKRIKSKELIKLPEEEWIKVENHHEAIISKEEFNEVQEMIKQRNEKKLRAGYGVINLFSGYLFCASCGSPMFCIKNKRFATHYQCGNYFKYGTKACKSHRIMEKSLIVTILNELKILTEKIQESLSNVEETAKAQSKLEKNYNNHIDKLKKDIENSKREKMIVYKDKVKGLISEEMYIEMTKEIDVNLKTMTTELEKLEKLAKSLNHSEKMLKSYLIVLEEIINDGLLTRDRIGKFINRIEINADKEIELIDWVINIEPMVQ